MTDIDIIEQIVRRMWSEYYMIGGHDSTVITNFLDKFSDELLIVIKERDSSFTARGDSMMTDIAEDQTTTEAPLPAELTISSLLRSTDAAEDRDHAFLMAFTINLYCEAMKRLQGRTLWKATDGQRLARLMNLLMELNAVKQVEKDIAEVVSGKPTR